MNPSRLSILVHLGAGVGNVVMATPLLMALHELGLTIDVLLAADYAETSRRCFARGAWCGRFSRDACTPDHLRARRARVAAFLPGSVRTHAGESAERAGAAARLAVLQK